MYRIAIVIGIITTLGCSNVCEPEKGEAVDPACVEEYLGTTCNARTASTEVHGGQGPSALGWHQDHPVYNDAYNTGGDVNYWLSAVKGSSPTTACETSCTPGGLTLSEALDMVGDGVSESSLPAWRLDYMSLNNSSSGNFNLSVPANGRACAVDTCAEVCSVEDSQTGLFSATFWVMEYTATSSATPGLQ